MAEPGDPSSRDHDDLIGFTSPGSLAGTARVPEPPKVPEWAEPAPRDRHDPTDDLFDDEPAAAAVEPEAVAPEPEPSPVAAAAEPGRADDLGPLFGAAQADASLAAPVMSRPGPIDFDTPPPPAPATSRPVAAAPEPNSALPAWARETPRAPNAGAKGFGRAQRAAPPEGAMGLYAVYALILFAVPTFGVSAVIALVAVIGRTVPAQDLAASHFLFQKRTLWAAAIGAAIGVVLIAVNLGVFVLVGMAIWVIVRGAAGLIRLAAGRPVENPLTWTI